MNQNEMHIDALMEKMEKLEAENARYREALTSIAALDHEDQNKESYWILRGITACSKVLANDTQLAREALKGE